LHYDEQKLALERFVAERGNRLLRTAALLAGSRADGEDLLQSALERLLRHWRRIDGDPENYVRRTLYNLAADGWRRRRVWQRHAVLLEPAPPVDPATAVDLRDAVVRVLVRLPPGQEVHVRVGPDVGSDGKVYKDGEYSFTMPAANPAANYTANLDQGGLQLSGTVMAVNDFRHVWSECPSTFILGFTLDPAGIRAELANGQFTVIGPTELDGQQAIELQINVPPDNEAPPHIVAERMWVNATTYVPMREYTRWSNGQQNVGDYVFLPPTPANLAKLRPVIPAGYTRASCARGSG
jgi:hypothetical protein